MSKSVRLATAIEILVYMAEHLPEPVTTKDIAMSLQQHPARVRQLVSDLVKKGILSTTRGTGGGSSLARMPAEITLEDIYLAVEEQSVLSVFTHDAKKQDDLQQQVNTLFETFENKLMNDMRSYSLTYFLNKNSR